MRSRVFPWIVLSVTLAGCGSTPAKPDWDRPAERKAEGIRVLTDGRADYADDLVSQWRELRARVAASPFALLATESARDVTAYVFATRDEYRSFADAQGMSPLSHGCYRVSLGALFMAPPATDADRARFETTARHELAHHLHYSTTRWSGPIRAWLSEGLAEWLARGEQACRDDFLVLRLCDLVADKGVSTEARLARLIAFQGDTNVVERARAYTLVRALASDATLRDRFADYVLHRAKPDDDFAAVCDALGVSMDDVVRVYERTYAAIDRGFIAADEARAGR